MIETLCRIDAKLSSMLCSDSSRTTEENVEEMEGKIVEAMKTWNEVMITGWDDDALNRIASAVAHSGGGSWIILKNIEPRIRIPVIREGEDYDDSFESTPPLWDAYTHPRSVLGDIKAAKIISASMETLASMAGDSTSSVYRMYDNTTSRNTFNTMWVARDNFNKPVAVVIRRYWNIHRMDELSINISQSASVRIEEEADETIDAEVTEPQDLLIGAVMHVYVKRFTSDGEQRSLTELLLQNAESKVVFSRFKGR